MFSFIRCRWLCLFAASAIFCVEARADDDDRLTPPDTLAVVRIRVHELWRSDTMKETRGLLAAVQPELLRQFESRFEPKLSTVASLTAFVVLDRQMLKTNRQMTKLPFRVAVVVTTTEAMTVAKVAACFVPEGKRVEGSAGTIYGDPAVDLAVTLLGPKRLVFGSAKAVAAVVQAAAAPAGSPNPIATAESAAPFCVTVAGELMRPLILQIPQPGQEIPLDFLPLLMFDRMSMSLTLDGKVALRAVYDDAKAARAAGGAFKRLVALGRAHSAELKTQLTELTAGGGKKGKLEQMPEAVAGLAGLAGLVQLDALLDNPPLRMQGDTLGLEATLPSWGRNYAATLTLGLGVALPGVQQMRLNAQRADDQNNLKRIGLALHNHYDTNRNFPASAIVDKGGKPLLSWRVALLPYIEQGALYGQFKLDEPWDSENNKKLIPFMPALYATPTSRAISPGDGKTHYQVFVGKGTMFPGGTAKVGLANITDGTSNTFMVAEGETPVVWTKPDDLAFDAKKPLAKLLFVAGATNVLFGDGSVRSLKRAMGDKNWRRYIQGDDGEAIEAETLPGLPPTFIDPNKYNPPAKP